ncbi:MAG TPA: TonB-dependent receptor [Chitinophagaceae bacterium]|nr:TonB-dependent receptor [Chitinophagaceae bacterium]
MKKTFLVILLFSYCWYAKAQTYVSQMSDDSSRIIALNEIIVNSIQKNPQHYLVRFFKANSAATLEDILSRLPEVSLIRRGSYGMEPSIRSFSGGQINVLVDGMRIHGACTDKMDPATIYIEPINLENLQVQTTASGFISGSTIGGTIDMKMAEPDFLQNKKLTGVVSSGYQSAANSFFESAKLNYSSNRWAFRASGTYRKSNNYRSGGGEEINFSQYEKLNYSLSAKFQQNNNTYIKADLLADDGWNIGYPALPMDVGSANARVASLSIHHSDFSKWLYKWQMKVYANKISHFMDDTKRPFVPIHMDMPGLSKTFGAFAEGEMKLNKKQRLSIRADGSSTYLSASMTMYQPGQLPMYMLTWPDNRKGQYGIAASWITEIDSTLKLQITSRADIITYSLATVAAKDQVSIFGYSAANRNDLLKNISTQLSKKITKNLKATGSISYSERMPTASELYGFYLFNNSDGFDYIGSPELKKENAWQADASILYSKGRNRVQFNYFYSRMANYIMGKVDPTLSTMTIGANGVKSYINISNASISGFEASAFLKPTADLDIVSTVRYTKGKDADGNPLPFIAPFKNLTSFRYQPGIISIQLESETALQQNKVSYQAGEDKTPGYFLLNTRLGYATTISKSSVELQVGVENIFDKKYYEHLDWGNINRSGRNIYVQTKLLF